MGALALSAGCDFGSSAVDGAWPYAGLTDLHGTLYGTTFHGGTHDDGTVFALTP